MITEKDCCDYETCVALEELGYPRYHYDNGGELDKILRMVTLYNAQKWLREEKHIEVVVLSKGMVGAPYYFQVYTEDFVVSDDKEYSTYEEALSEGIKEAVKILKENRKQALELENTEYDYGHNVYHKEL